MNQDGSQSQPPVNGVPTQTDNTTRADVMPQGVSADQISHSGNTPVAVATSRAKSVLAQYQNNPYQLSIELEHIKSAYATQQFNVTINPVED